jgi:hypothetical protein
MTKGIKLERVEMDSYDFWVLWKDKLYFHLITSGTGLQLVCRSMSACSSMSYPDVEDYEGRTGLSPPVAYPSTVEYETNEDNF